MNPDLGEPIGYDDRKQLADIWQDNGGTVPDGLDAIYGALIAVAQFGWQRAAENANDIIRDLEAGK